MIVGFAIPSGAARDEGGSVVAWYHLVRALRRAAAVLHEQLVLPHPPNHQRPCKVPFSSFKIRNRYTNRTANPGSFSTSSQRPDFKALQKMNGFRRVVHDSLFLHLCLQFTSEILKFFIELVFIGVEVASRRNVARVVTAQYCLRLVAA